MIVEEDALFTAGQADALGLAIVRQIANNRFWPAGITLRSEPLPPYESTSRRLPDSSSRPMPWQFEQHPRIEMRLRVRRFDIFGDELPREELVMRLYEARCQIATLLAQPVMLSDTYLEGTVDIKPELIESDPDRVLELRVGVTLFEV